MRLLSIQGIIRRRLLLNFRVDPDVMAARLPAPFRPKLQRGYAIAGICLIRLEQVRPPWVPIPYGLSSENAAHRVAVQCDGSEDAVYVPRRDSDSWLNHFVGGRLFSGEHHRARFAVEDDGLSITLRMASVDGGVSIEVAGRPSQALPAGSVFRNLAEASRFFERGSLGYSSTADPDRFDGLILDTAEWSVQPFAVSSVASSFFDDRTAYPEGSVTFDHALLMRNVEHVWHTAPVLYGRVARQPSTA